MSENEAIEESVEMFDEMPSGSDYDEPETFDSDWNDEGPDHQEQEEEEEESDTKSRGIDEKAIDKLEEQDDDEFDLDELEKELKEDDDEEEDEESDEESDEKEEAPKVKTIKGKHGENTHDVPQDATFKVPVGGKSEFPTLRDLMDNYSGKKKWTEEIETAKNEVRTIRHEKEHIDRDKNELMGHVKHIADLIDSSMKGEASPLQAMEYFLTLTGRSPYEYNKIMVDQMTPIVRELDMMSEAEIDGFWARLENEHLKSNRAAEMQRMRESESLKEKESEFAKLRESSGVSQEQFILAQQELKEFDQNEDWTHDKVIKYITVKPMYQATYNVMSDYKDLIEDFDGVQDDLVKYMQENPNTSEDEIREILIDALDIEPVAKKLKPKVSSNEPRKKAKKSNKRVMSEDDIDTFDDYYDY